MQFFTNIKLKTGILLFYKGNDSFFNNYDIIKSYIILIECNGSESFINDHVMLRD